LSDELLTIGEVAKRAGIRSSAIRYYERVGLIPHPERVSGQRRYEGGVVRRLELIAVAKEAGFSLDEVRVLLESADRGDPAHRQLRVLAERKLPEIEALIARAEAVREWLTVATDCGCESLDDCRLFVMLNAGFHSPDAVEFEVVQQGPAA
jgi:MerR family redox-sensitive transcriptional activator SoxR